jgi:hypothetical protein
MNNTDPRVPNWVPRARSRGALQAAMWDDGITNTHLESHTPNWAPRSLVVAPSKRQCGVNSATTRLKARAIARVQATAGLDSKTAKESDYSRARGRRGNCGEIAYPNVASIDRK